MAQPKLPYRLGVRLPARQSDQGRTVELAQALGRQGLVDFIELYVTPKDVRHLRRWAEMNLAYVVHAAHHEDGLALEEPEAIGRNLEMIESASRAADALEAETIIVHAPRCHDVLFVADQLSLVEEVRLLMENAAPAASLDFDGTCEEELRQIVCPMGIGCCLDLDNAALAAEARGYLPLPFVQRFARLQVHHYRLGVVPPVEADPAAAAERLRALLALVPDGAALTLKLGEAEPTPEMLAEVRCTLAALRPAR